MTQFPDLFAALAAPFSADEVKVRSQSGRQMHYVTARTVMNRLDSVLGPENWTEDYVPGENSVLCRLTITLPDGKTLVKADAGGYAGMADSGDDDKSGYSDAFKRAAVKLGVSRYLYRDGVPNFVQERVGASPDTEAGTVPSPRLHTPQAEHRKEKGKWGNPQPSPNGTQPERQAASGNANGAGGPPRTGKALFAWTRDQEQRYSVGLLKYLNNWSKLQEFPGRMVDWDHEQVALAYAEAMRKLQSIQSAGDDPYEEALAN